MKLEDVLNTWLKQAYLLEKEGLAALERHLPELEEKNPMVANLVREHMEETREHERIISELLDERDVEIPTLTEGAMKGMSAVKEAYMNVVREDDLLQKLALDYLMEQSEVITYTVLSSLAEVAQSEAILSACETVLPQEEAAASRLRESISLMDVDQLERIVQ